MKKLFFVLSLTALLLLPTASVAKVVVLDLTFPPDWDVKFFVEGIRSWFAYREAETGGNSQIYGLCVVGKKDRVEIYFDGEIEPRWQISRQEILRHPRSLIFPDSLNGHYMAEKIYKYFLRLEKERQKEYF